MWWSGSAVHQYMRPLLWTHHRSQSVFARRTWSIRLAILFYELLLSSEIEVKKKINGKRRIKKWVNVIPAMLCEALWAGCNVHQGAGWVENHWGKNRRLLSDAGARCGAVAVHFSFDILTEAKSGSNSAALMQYHANQCGRNSSEAWNE